MYAEYYFLRMCSVIPQFKKYRADTFSHISQFCPSSVRYQSSQSLRYTCMRHRHRLFLMKNHYYFSSFLSKNYTVITIFQHIIARTCTSTQHISTHLQLQQTIKYKFFLTCKQVILLEKVINNISRTIIDVHSKERKLKSNRK